LNLHIASHQPHALENAKEKERGRENLQVDPTNYSTLEYPFHLKLVDQKAKHTHLEVTEGEVPRQD